MINKLNQSTQSFHAMLAHWTTRVQELEAVLATVDAAWTELSQRQKRLAISEVRRGLVDIACDIDSVTASP